VGDLSLDALLRFLSTSAVTGTLTVVTGEGRGELDLSSGRVIGAFSGDAIGDVALRAIFSAHPRAFTFEQRAPRPANLSAPPTPAPSGVRASLSMLTNRTMLRFDAVSRESILRRARFGMKSPTLLDEPPAAENVWQPVQLAMLANALIGEYSGEQYGARLWNDDITSRFEAVRAAGLVVPRSFVVTRGRIDTTALGSDRAELVPFLRELIRAIYGEAKRIGGESSARRGYRAAVSRVWSAHERVLLAAQRIVDAPRPKPARLVGPSGATGLGDREHLIGRAQDSDTRLADPAVSRRHARIVPRGDGFVLRDLGSTTGTLVNGTRLVGEQPLHDGDVIRMGDVELRFEG